MESVAELVSERRPRQVVEVPGDVKPAPARTSARPRNFRERWGKRVAAPADSINAIRASISLAKARGCRPGSPPEVERPCKKTPFTTTSSS
jgi:hypothetical protein